MGKTQFNFVEEGFAVYQKRIARYCRFEVMEIASIKNAASLSPQELKTAEGKLLLQQLPTSSVLILLDVGGKLLSSEVFAQNLDKWKVAHSGKNLCFVIGGAYGFSEEVYTQAAQKISLSPMTFSHQLIRIVFAEQLYRAFSILRNEPYHNA